MVILRDRPCTRAARVTREPGVRVGVGVEVPVGVPVGVGVEVPVGVPVGVGVEVGVGRAVAVPVPVEVLLDVAGYCRVSWALALGSAVREPCRESVAVEDSVALLEALAPWRAPALPVAAPAEAVGEREARGLGVRGADGLARALREGEREEAGDFEGEEEREGEREGVREMREL
jgi:hypothetical protein